jgi:hypothetical protein
MLLTYFLNNFEIVPVAPIITDIAPVFTFHMRCISIVRSLYFKIFSASLLLLLLLLYDMDVSCHSPFLPGTSLEPAVIPTAQFHTAALSALCVMFQVQLSFVLNLSNVFPVQLPNVSLSF